MNLSTTLTEKCCKMGTEIRNNISQKSGLFTAIYLVTAALITGSLYIALHGTYLVGKADEIPEWEYLRNIMSAGVFGGALMVLIVVLIKIKQRKKTAD